MADEPRVETNIADELDKMGKLVAQAVRSAWESEERKKLEGEIVEGLRKFSDQVSTTAKKASESDAAKQIKVQAEKVAAEVKEKDVAEEIRKGLINGLEVVNLELGRLVERLEAKKTPAESAAAPETPSEPVAEAPAEPAPEAPQVD